jgi:signal transduction histidine kinase/CheY-like chemotaxis protein
MEELTPKPDFRLLFESVPGLYLVLMPDFRIIAVSDAYLRATMTKRESILGRDIFDVFPDNPQDPTATGVRNLRASLEAVLREKRSNAMAVQKYDIQRPASEGGGFETRYWSPVNSPAIDSEGQVVHIIHRVEDVTEFVRVKQVGRQHEETSQQLRVRADQMAAEVYARGQELAQANRELIVANEELARMYRQAAALLERAAHELGNLEHEESGTAVGMVRADEMMARVENLIVEYKRLEGQLRQAQKMEAVGLLAGGVAHDFNNLLTVIAGYTSLLRDQSAGGEPATELEEIDGAVARAAALTRKLLAFSSKQVQQPRTVDLNEVVSGFEGLLSRLIGEHIRLVTVLGSGIGKVRVDPIQLEQVIMNLAVNARDAMPAGGRLTIATKEITVDSGDTAGSIPPGRYDIIAVSDTGHGMDATTLTRIFEPFFTTKEPGKGTGLGLSTAHGIVRQSGGALTVESTPGQGTTFHVFLPVAEGALDEQQTGSPSLSVVPRRATVLIVEDEPPLRELVVTVLRAAGHDVLKAASGEEACTIAARHAGPIDILLTDVVMPGMSGPALAGQIRKTRSDIVVLYMSGYDRNLVRRHELGANFLPKPFTPHSLTSRIAELLARCERREPKGSDLSPALNFKATAKS